jgi:hypothetical protein
MKSSSPRKIKTSLHVKAEEPASEETTEYYFTPERESVYESPEHFPLTTLAKRNKPLARCLKKKKT